MNGSLQYIFKQKSSCWTISYKTDHCAGYATVLFRGPSDTNLVEKCAKIAAICYGLLQPFPFTVLPLYYRVKAFLKLHKKIFQRFQTAVTKASTI